MEHLEPLHALAFASEDILAILEWSYPWFESHADTQHQAAKKDADAQHTRMPNVTCTGMHKTNGGFGQVGRQVEE